MKLKKIFKDAGGRRKKKKINWNILSRIDSVKLKRPGRVLVFETTGFELYGRIATAGMFSGYKLGRPAMSADADFAGAVKEIKAQLRKQTRFLPKTAVLITPCAAGDLLSLPVDPRKPRPKIQMAEMVRWELEELFVRLGDIWSLEALLQGRGYISADQRANRSGQGPGAGAGAVWGELVSPDRIEECLKLQETLSAMDDDLVTGWAPQGGSDAPFIWFGAGIGMGLREKWSAAFRENGLFLSWIYPQQGAALAMLNTDAIPEESGWLFMDVRSEQAGLFQGRQQRLESFTLAPVENGQPDPVLTAKAVVRFIHPKTFDIFVSGPEPLFVPLVMEIKKALNRPDIRIRRLIEPAAQPLSVPAGDGAGAPGESTAGPAADDPESQDSEPLNPSPEPAPVLLPVQVAASLEGAARHALRRCPAGSLVRIEAQDPKPPLWKNKALWPWAGIVLLAVALGANFFYMRHMTEKKQWELDLLDIEYERRLRIKEEARSTNSEAGRLMAQLEEREGKLAERENLKTILNDVIRYRQDLVPGVLTAIGNAVTEEVVLDLIEEDPDRSGFYMEAWALKDTEAQLFGKRLNEALAPWGYRMDRNIQLTAGKGRMDLDGYRLNIRIIRTATEKAGKK